MFMVFSKDKICAYLISLSTVAILFVMSFAITKKNQEILKTSANAVRAENMINTTNNTNNANSIETK